MMRYLAFLLACLLSSVAVAQPTRGPARNSVGVDGMPLSGGTMEGPIAWCVITQTADDTTPSVGVDGGCTANTGGNILETSSTNSVPTAITDLDSPLVGMIIYVVGTGGANPSTIADGGRFNLETAWTGAADNILELYVQADDDYVEVTRHNGVRYFDNSITVNGSIIGADADTIANASAGAWTFWGTGATSAEDLTYTFGATADQVDVASSTSVATVDWGTLNHALAAMSLSGNVTLESGGSIVTTSDGDIDLTPNGSGVVDVTDAELYIGDGTYSWNHSPILATEGIFEAHGVCYMDGGANLSDSDILNPSVVYQEAQTSDAAADAICTKAGNPFHKATVEVNGAANIQCGGIGVKSMAVVQATAAGSTITITTTDAVGAYTSTTLTLVAGAPGANEIQCITSDAVCAAAIVTYLASNVAGVTAEAVSAQVYLIPSATLCNLGLSSADGTGTKFVLTNGEDGQVLVTVGTAAAPSIGFTWDTDTGIRSDVVNANRFYFVAGGTDRAVLKTTEFDLDVPLELAAADQMSWAGLTELRAPDDGKLQICNAAETNCICIDSSGLETNFYNGNCSASSQYQFNGRMEVTILAPDSGSDGAFALRVNDASNYEFIGSSGTQYSTIIQPEVNNSGTAGFTTLLVDLIGTTGGSGRQLLVDLHRAGITQFSVDETGDFFFQNIPTTDTAAEDGRLFGANAYAMATGGSRNGASLNEAGGIRTLQIVCSDRTLTDTDTITLVVDGADTVLTESTDFNCEGEASEEVCCDNISAAIVTAAIGLTPDAATTAGTIYITPDEDILWIEDIFYTDGGVNDVGWTLTEGTDGDIGLYGDDILTKIWNVDYVVRAGTGSSPPSAPSWEVNDSCAGLGWDADAEFTNIFFEIPSCWAGRARDDLTLKIYWCPEDGQAPANTEVVQWDISYRVLDWGTDDVDTGASVTASYIYTQSGAGDEGDTFEHEITIDADDTDQPLVKGEMLSIHFDRHWSHANNYPHDAITPVFEITVPQTSLKCDHHN